MRFDIDIAASAHDMQNQRYLRFGDGNQVPLPADPIFVQDAFNNTVVRYTVYHTYARGVDLTQHASLELCCVAKYVTGMSDQPFRLFATVQLDPKLNTSSPYMAAVSAVAFDIAAARNGTAAATAVRVPLAWAHMGDRVSSPVRYSVANDALGGRMHAAPRFIDVEPYLGYLTLNPDAASAGLFLMPLQAENVLTGATALAIFAVRVTNNVAAVSPAMAQLFAPSSNSSLSSLLSPQLDAAQN